MKLFFPNIMLKGLAMGIAEVIPGVSGGTIAFITGIYERLIKAIASFDGKFFNLLFKGEFRLALALLDIPFILSLLSGMAVGIIFGVFTISHLLIHYPEPLWGFFFGLIVASAVYIGRQFDFKKVSAILAIIIGFGIAYMITLATPVEGSTSYLFIFLSGVIAISAMLLPGISGSFMLVLMGMYSFILGNVKSILTGFDGASISIIAVFVMGLIVGASTFSRIFLWLFSRYKDFTLAILTGFLLGSLNKIWPWRNVTQVFDKEQGIFIEVKDLQTLQQLNAEVIKVVTEVQVMPFNYWGDPKTLITCLVCIIGFFMVFTMDFVKKGKL